MADPMTPERLAEIDALLDEISPGEWSNPGTYGEFGWTVRGPAGGVETEDSEQGKIDAEFIGTAPGIVREMRAEVEQLRGDLRELTVLRRDMAAVQAERDAALDGEPEPVRLRAEVERLRAELATVAADTLRRFAEVIDNGPAVTGKKAIELPPRVYSDLARKEADRAAGGVLDGAEADRG
ncbi:hypothetical protein GCM10022254_09180 [Actinomadura meridiana]|uniref:Uncharacterized protein n=1 Tax=Actinomadura meridiana TaxID=559626 RepID=A0ABP8BTU5_9ACTN